MPVDDPVDLEQQGWTALSTDGQAARAFYDRVLDRKPVMFLPGGQTMDDRDAIIESMSGLSWSSYELEDLQSLRPIPDVAVVIYAVVAHRDAQRYTALLSSMYVRRQDGWKLAFHQQTPR